MLNALYATVIHQMRVTLSRPIMRFVLFVQPFFYAVLTYYLYKDSLVDNLATYVITGSALSSLWTSVSFSSASDISRERLLGTLESISVTTTSFSTIIIGKLIGNMLLTVLPFLCVAVFVRIVFGLVMSVEHPLLALGAFALVLASVMSISLAMAGIFTMSRHTHYFMNSIEFPIYIMSGIVFPISILPEWLQLLSRLSPLTWSIQLMRNAINQVDLPSTFARDIAITAALAVIFLMLGIMLFQRVDRRVRLIGNLNLE